MAGNHWWPSRAKALFASTLSEGNQATFQSHVEKLATECGCWIWTGCERGKGYGVIDFGKGGLIASRIAYALRFGCAPEGVLVCHRCDTPSCVNPDHLFLGTHKDNRVDSVQKGRVPVGDDHWANRMPELVSRGEKNGMAILTEEVVRNIRKRREEGSTYDQLSAEFRTSRSNVCFIVRRETWRHVV